MRRENEIQFVVCCFLLGSPPASVTRFASSGSNPLARLDRYYLNHPVNGVRYDQFDRDGKSLIATIPASSFYHVLCSCAEAEQVLGC
jgi:mannose/cellobiose epimerase-like protein (N-acyl-D-glucosamine 2-epimerase family)